MRGTRLLLAALCLFVPQVSSAQGVLVAPPALFVDHNSRSSAVELYNPAAVPVEVSVSAVFGYPVSDSLGETVLRTVETPAPDAPSAAEWIQAFPRRMTMRAGQRQTVRLLLRPPAGLPDGEYWSRLIVESRAAAQPVDALSDSGEMRFSMALTVQTAIALLYRKGEVHTGVAVSGLRTELTGDSLVVRVNLAREGSAAFIGALRAELSDSVGHRVATASLPVAVYYSLEPRLAIPATLSAGRYRLDLQLDTVREEIPKRSVLPVAPVRWSVTVNVPARTRASR